jgi:uncharacterized glyoxalase superfamily protein PhnB
MERCLGGESEAMLTHAGTRAEQQAPAQWRSKILHARLVVGEAAASSILDCASFNTGIRLRR